MLLKLIKYEIKSTYVRFLVACIVFTFICIFAPLFVSVIIPSAKGGWLSELGVSIIVSGIMAFDIFIFVSIFQRYNRNLYGNEGYLMFTLPVSGSKLLMSKVITSTVTIMISVGFNIIAMFNIDVIYRDKYFNAFVSRCISNFQATTWPITIANFFISIVTSIVTVFFCVTVSKLPLWRRFGTFMGFVCYFALGAVTTYNVADGLVFI